MHSVTERRGALLGGALFAATNHIDAGLLTDSPRLMVHSVAPGSVAESAGLEVYDQLITVDGRTIDSIEDLATLIGHADGESHTFEVIRFVDYEKQFSEYFVAKIELSAPEWISFEKVAEPFDSLVAATEISR